MLFETVMRGVIEMEHVRRVTPQPTMEENISYLTPPLCIKKIARTLSVFSSIRHKIKRSGPCVSLSNVGAHAVTKEKSSMIT